MKNNQDDPEIKQIKVQTSQPVRGINGFSSERTVTSPLSSDLLLWSLPSVVQRL
jgi:hypothetical protein